MCETSRRQNFDSTICEKFDLTTNYHFLTSLVGTRVSVYFVSPLINFSFKPGCVKTLLEEFVIDVGKFMSRAEGKIRIRDQPFGSCLEFSVQREGKRVYNSFLFSIFENGENSTNNQAVLPFLCVTSNSQIRLGKHVKNFIEERFLCAVENCRMSDTQMQESLLGLPHRHDLTVLLVLHNHFRSYVTGKDRMQSQNINSVYSIWAIWLLGISLKETLKRDSNDGMALTLSPPSSTDGSFGLKWTAESLRNVWEVCSTDEDENIISLECIVKFVLAVNEHHMNTFGLDISTFVLKRISLLDVDILQEDTLKVLACHTEIFYAILYFLHAECVQGNPYLKPSFLRKLAPLKNWNHETVISDARRKLKELHETTWRERKAEGSTQLINNGI